MLWNRYYYYHLPYLPPHLVTFTFLSLFPHFKVEFTLELLRGLRGRDSMGYSAQWLDHSMHSLLTIVFSEKSSTFGKHYLHSWYNRVVGGHSLKGFLNAYRNLPFFYWRILSWSREVLKGLIVSRHSQHP